MQITDVFLHRSWQVHVFRNCSLIINLGMVTKFGECNWGSTSSFTSIFWRWNNKHCSTRDLDPTRTKGHAVFAFNQKPMQSSDQLIEIHARLATPSPFHLPPTPELTSYSALNQRKKTLTTKNVNKFWIANTSMLEWRVSADVVGYFNGHLNVCGEEWKGGGGYWRTHHYYYRGETLFSYVQTQIKFVENNSCL